MPLRRLPEHRRCGEAGAIDHEDGEHAVVMRRFTYQRAQGPAEAVQMAAAGVATDSHNHSKSAFLAGGTTLLDLMKLDVMQPDAVIDINPLAEAGYGRIELNQHGLRLGALVRMADAADHPGIRSGYPVIAQSLAQAASQQLRNMASLGGNVLQRTRCTYFRDVSYRECNKRNPGSGCAAMSGFNRMHAVLGGSAHCIATYPGDFAQALIALEAAVEIASGGGNRTIPFANLHRKPADTPDKETNLRPGEMIAAFLVPAANWTRRSLYLKVRDRESYEFALASAAVALHQQNGVVRTARIALGGLATVPWRALDAESFLRGKPVNQDNAAAAASAAFADARGHGHNDFKIELGKRTLIRALQQAAALEI
jgi:xanthine dehydrogenase YagS FAD-binding subunit